MSFYDLIQFWLKKIKFNFPQQINKIKIMNNNASKTKTHITNYYTAFDDYYKFICFPIFLFK